MDAEENSQLMCYGIAALSAYESLYDIEEVSLSIFQPSRENVQTWTVSVEELKAWAEKRTETQGTEWLPRAKANIVPESGANSAVQRSSAVQGQQKKLRIAEEEFKLPPFTYG